MDVLGQTELLGDDRSRIMIACDEVNGSPFALESNHLRTKKQASAIVFPIAIVEVAGDHDEVH